MRQFLLSIVLCLGMINSYAQESLTKKNTMEKKTSTIRLVYPQWQGARIAEQIPELKNSPEDASKGII